MSAFFRIGGANCDLKIAQAKKKNCDQNCHSYYRVFDELPLVLKVNFANNDASIWQEKHGIEFQLVQLLFEIYFMLKLEFSYEISTAEEKSKPINLAIFWDR